VRHKHFFGTSVQDALQRARYKMGTDVFLIETKPLTISGSDKTGLIQITVGIPEAERRVFPKNRQRSSGSVATKSFSEYLDQFGKGLYSPEINRKRNGARRSLKTDHQKKMKNIHENNDVITMLLNAGIFPEHAKIIQDKVSSDSQQDASVIDKLENIFRSMFDSGVSREFLKKDSQRIIALIGPTGVGKTSVIMKMAANKHFFRDKKTAIISADVYRIAGAESLRAFSDLVGVKFLELRHSDELPAKIDALKEYEVILIDTPGRSPLFPNYFNELQYSFVNDPRIEVQVVLSATADIEDIFLSSALYTLLDPVGLVVTKLDETSRVGKLVSMQNGIGLPILFISDGQSIPLDLTPVNGYYLWKKVSSLF